VVKNIRLILDSKGPVKKRMNLPTWGPTSFSFGMTPKKQVLPDAGNQPDATQKHLDYYRRNKDNIIPPIVKSSLKKHPNDVLHGSRSLKMLIPNYPRDPEDWDVLSPEEKRRALAYEKAIDERVGADIAQTHYIQIPKTSIGPDDPGTSKHLYRVVIPRISNDAEIDVMDRPDDLKTERHKGITHEALTEQYKKAVARKSRQPLKAQKALADQRAIESHWERQGKMPPVVEERRKSFGMTGSIRLRRNFQSIKI
jgi:hypothetical protein